MSVFATMPGLYNAMVRTVGIAAVSLSASLTSATALAEDPSARPADSYSPYRPEPTQPYVFGSRSTHSEVVSLQNGQEVVISESTPWWEEKDGRFLIYGIFAAVVSLTAAAMLWQIHKHKDEIDNRP